MPSYVDITPESLKKFKQLVRRKVSLSKEDKYVFLKLDDEMFRPVFKEVFNGDLELAKRVLYNMVSKKDKQVPISELERIPTLKKAVSMVSEAVLHNQNVLLISDADNDGSLAQGIGFEFARFSQKEIDVQPAKFTADTHGFSIEQIEEWMTAKGISKNDEFVVMTADIGTNQIAEQKAFESLFPKASLVITDHHKPMLDKMVNEDTPRSVLVNPYSVSELSERDGSVASGGYMLHLLLKNVAESVVLQNPELKGLEQYVHTTELMGEASNLLDYVHSDVRIKPLREGDADRAATLGRTMRQGALGKWLSPAQEKHIDNLKSSLDAEAAANLEEIRSRIHTQNFMAKTLLDVIPMVLDKEPIHRVEAEIIKRLAKPEGTNSTEDYITQIKGRFAQFTYEQSLDASVKNAWLKYAQNMFDQVNIIGKDISTLIRENELLYVRVHEECVVTRAISDSVKDVFSAKQLAKAYYGAEKQLNMTISHATPSSLSLRFRSKTQVTSILRDMEDDFPFGKVNVVGHPFAGELNIKLKKGVHFDNEIMDTLFYAIDKGAIEERGLQKARHLVEVDFFNIDAVMKINNAMKSVVFSSEEFQIQPIIKLNESMTLTNDYSLMGLNAQSVVSEAPWEHTSVSLDFDNSTTVLLPNTAIKSALDSNFENRIKLIQSSGRSFLGTDIVTPAQMERDLVVSIKTHKTKERELITDYHKKHFSEGISKRVTREEMIEAIKFVSDPNVPFERHEALVLDSLNRTKKEAYAVLDIEANDGGTDPKCFNVGIMTYTRKEGSGEVISQEKFDEMVKSKGKITNFRAIDGGILINEQVDGELVTVVINEDDISLPVKVERLTNMSKPMVAELGMSANDADEKLVEYLSQFDGYITQAHNLLGYDLTGIRANFPAMYEHISENIFFDSAPVSRSEAVVYINTEVAALKIGTKKVNFVTTPGADYSVVTKLMDKSGESENFKFPCVKGEHVLDVRGDDVFIANNKTQIVTQLKLDRVQLAHNMIRSSGAIPVNATKYSVAYMMKMSSIRDLLDANRTGNIIKKDFDGMGLLSTSPELDSLWELFQERYDFSASLTENMAKLSQTEEYKNAGLGVELGELASEEQPTNLNLAKQHGVYSGFEKAPNKTQMKAIEAAQNTVTGYDVFKANALNYLSNNKEVVNQYSLAWAYRLLLDHEEPTARNEGLEKGHIQGISRDYGVDVGVAEKIYDTTYNYKKGRGGVSSYTAEETHQNVNLGGDAYQEGIAYSNVLCEKTKNPFLNEPVPSKALELNYKGMMRTTWIAHAREVLRATIERIRVNSYSQRQKNAFDFKSRGRDEFLNKTSNAMLKLPNLSDGEYVEFNDMTADSWFRKGEEERELIEEHVKRVVDAVVLENSLKSIKDEDAKTIMEGMTTSDDVKASIKYLEDNVGSIKMNVSESKFKEYSDLMVSTLVDGAPYKLSINKWVNNDEINLLKSMALEAADILREKFAHPVHDDYISHINDQLEKARAQYNVFDNVRAKGKLEDDVRERYKEYIAGPVSSEITKLIKALEGKSQLVAESFPELSSTLLTKKTNPIGNFLSTREVGGAVEKMKYIRDFARQNTPENFELKQEVNGVSFRR